ncbi:MAG: hypothetical protein GX607_16515 [Myxococcales bacterium]|nr:hypothetical protein [Myxococcales bacterium]
MSFAGLPAWLWSRVGVAGALWGPVDATEGRPPPGLARGLVSVPAWVVLAVAGLLVLGTLAHLTLRRRGER